MKGIIEMSSPEACEPGQEAVREYRFGQTVRLMGDDRAPLMWVTGEVWVQKGFRNEISCVWFGANGQRFTGSFDHRLLCGV